MSEENANLDTGAASDVTGVDPVAAFSELLEKRINPDTEAPEGEAETLHQEQVEDKPDDNAEDQDETLYRLKVNGEEIEVPLSELLNGYSRESDYRNKTKALADERRAVEQYIHQHREEATQQRQQLQEAVKFVMAQLPDVKPPNPELINDSPVEYLRQREAYERAQAQQQAIYEQYVSAQQQQQAEQQRVWQENYKRGNDIVLQVVPEWNDTGTRAQESQAILQMAQNYGFTPQEFSQLTDPRYVVFMRDAMKNAQKAQKFDELQAKSSATAKQVQKLPTKAERPGAGRNISASDGRTSAMQSLKRSGSVDDAAAVFSKMLG